MDFAPPVMLRDATLADLDALAALRPPRRLHVDRVADAPADEADRRYLLALIANQIAGFGVIYFRGDPAWQRPERVPLVMDLWVAPPLRRRGVGRAIMQALERAAADRGFSCVYLQVQPERDRAIVRMYERMGYQKLQERPYRDCYAEVDDAGVLREGDALILDMRKWL